jgi:hypothetical protein
MLRVEVTGSLFREPEKENHTWSGSISGVNRVFICEHTDDTAQ